VDVGGIDHSSCSWEAGGVLSSSRSGAADLFVLEIIGTTRVCCIVSVRTVEVLVPSPSRLSSVPGRRLNKNKLRRGDHDRRSFSLRGADDAAADVVSAPVGDETGNRRNRETMVRLDGASDSRVYAMWVREALLLLPERSWLTDAGHDPFFRALGKRWWAVFDVRSADDAVFLRTFADRCMCRSNGIETNPPDQLSADENGLDRYIGSTSTGCCTSLSLL
jgi:hypothetical protein